MATQTFVPDGVGDYTNIASVEPALSAHWSVVDDPPGSPTDADYVHTTANEKDAYELVDHTTESGTINSVTVYFRILGDGTSTPHLRLAASETAGTPVNNSGAWTTHNEALAKPGGGAFSWTDIDNLQVVIELDGTTHGYCTQIYIEVDYTPPAVMPNQVHIIG